MMIISGYPPQGRNPVNSVQAISLVNWPPTTRSRARGRPTAISAYLNGITPQLDVDGDGKTNPLSDGLMLIRYLFRQKFHRRDCNFILDHHCFVLNRGVVFLATR